MGPIRCPETSVNDYHTTPRNIPEERRSHRNRGGSLKSRFPIFVDRVEFYPNLSRNMEATGIRAFTPIGTVAVQLGSVC
jgi:hypothetical protein